MLKIFFKLFLFIGFLSNTIYSQNKNVLGIWQSENKKQRIKVLFNPQTNLYYGKIVYMYEDDQENGRKMLDVNNPNKSLRSRRMTGTFMLLNFKDEKNNKFKGLIYDPVSGKNYKCNLTVRPDGKTAEIRGYIFHPIIGRTEIATKISD